MDRLRCRGKEESSDQHQKCEDKEGVIEKGGGGEMKGIRIRIKRVRRENKMIDRNLREVERDGEWNKMKRGMSGR